MKPVFMILACSMSLFAVEQVELPLPKSQHITINYMFKVGSVDDPAGKEGLANLTAQLMSGGGTKDLTKQEIDDLFYPMAVSNNLSVDKEAIVFSATVHRDHWDAFYKVAADLVYRPRFDTKDFERIKKSVLKAITKDIPNQNDEVLSKRVLDQLMFAGHPYAHLVPGTEKAVTALTLDDVKSFYAKHFTQANLMIGIAGGYDKSVFAKFKADTKRLPKGQASKRNMPVVRMPKGIEARIVAKPNTFGTAIFMGYPMDIDRSKDEFAALMVANSYLGEHRKSYGVLYDRMRSTRSLNYGDYSYIEWYPNGHATQLPLSGYPRSQNFFSIWIRPVQIAAQFKGIEGLQEPALGNGHFVIRQSLRELNHLVEHGIAEADFQRTRSFLQGYLRLFIQSQSRRLGFLMDSRFYGRKDYIGDMIKLLDGLKRDDVNRAIKKYMQADNMYVSIITDPAEAKVLAKTLKTNGSAPIVYKPVVRSGLEKKVLDEDKAIDAYKLNVTDVSIIPSESLFKQ